MRGRHRRTSKAPPGPQTIRDEPCHIPPRRSPSQVPMISPQAAPPTPHRPPPPPKENPECASVELARRFPPSPPLSSDQVDPWEGKKKKERTVGEECAAQSPRFEISRCHGLAFPSPQSRDHTTAYRCGEARRQEALRSPLPLPRSSGAHPSHLPFKKNNKKNPNMSSSRCLEINRQALPPPPPPPPLRTRAHDRNFSYVR